MKTGLTVLTLAVLVIPTTAVAQSQSSDFALFDGTDPAARELGAACGARQGSSSNALPFTYFVTVSNWSGSTKVLRVLYADDEEMARYQIPAGTSFSFSQAAGGTAGVDDFVRIIAEGPTPSGLAGSVSMLSTAPARPHPALGGRALCITLTATP